MDSLFSILVGAAALPLLVLGLRAMFAPRSMQAPFAVSVHGAAGLNTIRSVAGGLFFACVSLLGWSLVQGDASGVFAVAAVMICVAAGRVVGIVFDGFDKAVLPPLVVEVILAVVLLFAAGTHAGA